MYLRVGDFYLNILPDLAVPVQGTSKLFYLRCSDRFLSEIKEGMETYFGFREKSKTSHNRYDIYLIQILKGETKPPLIKTRPAWSDLIQIRETVRILSEYEISVNDEYALPYTTIFFLYFSFFLI